jgi:predicted Zn finger-like uncharacterized protein
MKFYCDSCNTKYGIADEKVRGKVLKVRCKKCSNVITVREQSVPVDQGAGQTTLPPKPPEEPAADPRSVEWHYSLNGQSFGPFDFDALAQRVASGELGNECYVWTDSFSSWKPVGEVDAFQSVLVKGQRIKPRRDTVGVSQALEAIKPEDFKRRQQQAKEAQSAEELRAEDLPADEPEPSAAQADVSPTPDVENEADDSEQPSESEKLNDGQKDRLAKLRERLKSTSKKAPAGDDELIADGGAAQRSPPKATAQKDAVQKDADAHGPTLPMDVSSEDEDLGDHSGLFADADLPEASTTSASLPDQPADDAENSDRIPFLGDAPELRSDPEKVAKKPQKGEGITGSLLIQLDSIQKQGRGKKVVMVVAALVIIGWLVVTAIYFAGQVEPEEQVQNDSVDVDEDEDELVENTYSAEERSKIMVLGSQRVGEVGEVGEDEGSEEAEAEAEEADPVVDQPADKPAEKRARSTGMKDDSAAMDKAFAAATKKGAADDGLEKTIDDSAVSKTKIDSPIKEKSDAFKGVSALQSDRSDSIYNPTDSLEERKKSSTGTTKLNRKQISQGMRTVRRSIAVCRQRHTRRGTALDARKIYLTITLEPTGRISAFELDPERIRHTEFENCMSSHRGRWKFPSFDGSSQRMRAPFVLQ